MNFLTYLATVPPASNPAPVEEAADASRSVFATLGDVLSATWTALGNDGYQTGVSLLCASAAIVVMINIRTNKFVTAIVAIGAFWTGWLAYNTFNDTNNQLFPSEVGATKLWDIVFTSGSNFLLVSIVASIAAIFLWRRSIKLLNRVLLMVGAIMGASLLYNLFEAFKAAAESA